MLITELDFFLEHQDEFARDHYRKFIVINGAKIVGFYDTEEDAYKTAVKSYRLGEFLIRQCIAASETVAQAFHSRAVFA